MTSSPSTRIVHTRFDASPSAIPFLCGESRRADKLARKTVSTAARSANDHVTGIDRPRLSQIRYRSPRSCSGWCSRTAPRMSNPIASEGIRVGLSRNKNSASGSMWRRMSRAQRRDRYEYWEAGKPYFMTGTCG